MNNNQEHIQVSHKQEEDKLTDNDKDNTIITKDNENISNMDNKNMKKTFTPEEKEDIRQKIQKFQKVSSSDSSECVLGSGHCAYHNCKLVRVLAMKKLSMIVECGKLSWNRREVTSLACPKASQAKSREWQINNHDSYSIYREIAQ